MNPEKRNEAFQLPQNETDFGTIDQRRANTTTLDSKATTDGEDESKSSFFQHLRGHDDSSGKRQKRKPAEQPAE